MLVFQPLLKIPKFFQLKPMKFLFYFIYISFPFWLLLLLLIFGFTKIYFLFKTVIFYMVFTASNCFHEILKFRDNHVKVKLLKKKLSRNFPKTLFTAIHVFVGRSGRNSLLKNVLPCFENMQMHGNPENRIFCMHPHKTFLCLKRGKGEEEIWWMCIPFSLQWRGLEYGLRHEIFVRLGVFSLSFFFSRGDVSHLEVTVKRSRNEIFSAFICCDKFGSNADVHERPLLRKSVVSFDVEVYVISTSEFCCAKIILTSVY